MFGLKQFRKIFPVHWVYSSAVLDKFFCSTSLVRANSTKMWEVKHSNKNFSRNCLTKLSDVSVYCSTLIFSQWTVFLILQSFSNFEIHLKVKRTSRMSFQLQKYFFIISDSRHKFFSLYFHYLGATYSDQKSSAE